MSLHITGSFFYNLEIELKLKMAHAHLDQAGGPGVSWGGPILIHVRGGSVPKVTETGRLGGTLWGVFWLKLWLWTVWALFGLKFDGEHDGRGLRPRM